MAQTQEQKDAAKAKREEKKAAELAAKEAAGSKTTIVVTQEYLDAHPEAVEQGATVGMEIEVEEVPAPVGEEPEPAKGGDIPKVKKGEGYSILKNGEYIRTYDNKEDATMFCTKKAMEGVHAVPESTVVGVEVEFDERTESGTMGQKSRSFTPGEDGADFKAQAVVFKNQQKNGFAKAILAE